MPSIGIALGVSCCRRVYRLLEKQFRDLQVRYSDMTVAHDSAVSSAKQAVQRLENLTSENEALKRSDRELRAQHQETLRATEARFREEAKRWDVERQELKGAVREAGSQLATLQTEHQELFAEYQRTLEAFEAERVSMREAIERGKSSGTWRRG